MKKSALNFMIMAALMFSGCGKQAVQNEEISYYVSVEKAAVKEMKNEYKTSATLKGIEDVFVYSKVDGKLLTYKVREGDFVKKDQVIALIDRDMTGMKYEPAVVKAPISGIVGQTMLDKGEAVIPGQMPLAMVSNMNIVETRIELPEKYLPAINRDVDVSFEVEAYPGELFEGYLYSFTPVSDPMTHTVTMRLRAVNKGLKMRSGMFARVTLSIESRDVVAVPEESVVARQYVFVHENGRAAMKKVTTGVMYDTYVEIVSGIDEGEEVIVAGQKYLNDDVKVKVR